MSILGATYQHPLSGRWSQPGGPWGDESLDDLLAGTTPVEDLVAEVAGGLAGRGVRAGDTVAWQLPNGWPAIALFRACWRLGAVAAPIHHLAGAADRDRMLARLTPAVFVADEAALPVGPPRRPAATAVDPASPAVALGTSARPGPPRSRSTPTAGWSTRRRRWPRSTA